MLITDLFQLVERAQSGDDQAMETIITQFEPLIWKVSRHSASNEMQDLQQHIHEKMIQAVYKYDMSALPKLDECMLHVL